MGDIFEVVTVTVNLGKPACTEGIIKGMLGDSHLSEQDNLLSWLDVSVWCTMYGVDGDLLWKDFQSGVLEDIFYSLPFSVLEVRYNLPTELTGWDPINAI